jgi:hypothetical protein
MKWFIDRVSRQDYQYLFIWPLRFFHLITSNRLIWMQKAHLNFNHLHCRIAGRNMHHREIESCHTMNSLVVWRVRHGCNFHKREFHLCSETFSLCCGASVRNLIISHQIKCTRGWCAIASCGDFSALERNAHQRRQRESVTARHCVCCCAWGEVLWKRWERDDAISLTLNTPSPPRFSFSLYVSGAKGEEMHVWMLRSRAARRETLGRKWVFHFHMSPGPGERRRSVKHVVQLRSTKKVSFLKAQRRISTFSCPAQTSSSWPGWCWRCAAGSERNMICQAIPIARKFL